MPGEGSVNSQHVWIWVSELRKDTGKPRSGGSTVESNYVQVLFPEPSYVASLSLNCFNI